MGEFTRNPSKIWWANDNIELRATSASPGSQDSGFSDTETSNHLPAIKKHNQSNDQNVQLSIQKIPDSALKKSLPCENKQNLTVNCKDKLTPNKNLDYELINLKKSNENHDDSSPNNKIFKSGDGRKQFTNPSRKLFTKNSLSDVTHNQYSNNVFQETSHLPSGELPFNNSAVSSKSDFTQSDFSLFRQNEQNAGNSKLSHSAPAVLDNKHDNAEEDTDSTRASEDNSLNSDCESELSCLFRSDLESPKHTSTPKAEMVDRIRKRKAKIPMKLYLQYQNERVPPFHVENEIENKAVEMWMKETRTLYELECMTTFQSKSIEAEINEKVSHMAFSITGRIRRIFMHSGYIEEDFEKIRRATKHTPALAQSLAGNIIDFVNTYKGSMPPHILKQCDDIRTAHIDLIQRLITSLYAFWENVRKEVYNVAIRELVDKLENPSSELELRAIVSSVTSIALRDEKTVELFVNTDVIPILLILCEKCEGSSMRSLILRALSAMCCVSQAVRHFEKFSGIQLIADILEDESKPEPEKSEAVTVLVQVTAPWIEDNNSVKGLGEYSKSLVKSLNKLIASTKCCQNLLLSIAALANLTSMDISCVKYVLHYNGIELILEAVKKRGSRASVYLLEQVATLLATVSAVEGARSKLVNLKVPTALMCFTQTSGIGEDVEKRLQQKSIIALSKLCSDKEAAKQIVDVGGVDKLVQICRKKELRYDSDAVLVATLATLRKIAEVCGKEVISVQDSQELVEPKLLDSFLAYSSQNESYV